MSSSKPSEYGDLENQDVENDDIRLIEQERLNTFDGQDPRTRSAILELWESKQAYDRWKKSHQSARATSRKKINSKKRNTISFIIISLISSFFIMLIFSLQRDIQPSINNTTAISGSIISIEDCSLSRYGCCRYMTGFEGDVFKHNEIGSNCMTSDEYQDIQDTHQAVGDLVSFCLNFILIFAFISIFCN